MFWILVVLVLIVWLIVKFVKNTARDAKTLIGSGVEAVNKAVAEAEEQERPYKEEDAIIEEEAKNLQGEWLDMNRRVVITRDDKKRVGYLYKVTDPEEFAGVYISPSNTVRPLPPQNPNCSLRYGLWKAKEVSVKCAAIEYVLADSLIAEHYKDEIWKLTEEEIKNPRYL